MDILYNKKGPGEYAELMDYRLHGGFAQCSTSLRHSQTPLAAQHPQLAGCHILHTIAGIQSVLEQVQQMTARAATLDILCGSQKGLFEDCMRLTHVDQVIEHHRCVHM